MGYAQSKWIAEAICAKAYTTSGLRDRIAVLRIGQLCGDGEKGVWNVTEAWPLMFSAVAVTEALPDLGEGEVLGWLKVDLAAEAVVQTMFSMVEPLDKVGEAEVDKEGDKKKNSNLDGDHGNECPVYHLINRHTAPTWTTMLSWVRSWEPEVEIVAPGEWVDRLENLQGEKREHPARKLLGLWKGAYAGEEGGQEKNGEGGQEKNEEGGKAKNQGTGQDKKVTKFEMGNSVKAAPVLADVKPIDEVFFGKVWKWVKSQEGSEKK